MKIVPPKQNGTNCVVVSLCHAANYFGVVPTDNADFTAARVPTLSKILLELAYEFLPGLELTLWIHPNNINGGYEFGTIVPIEDDGAFRKVSIVHEAVIASIRSGNDTYHSMFKVDETEFSDQLSYILFIHEPGVERQ